MFELHQGDCLDVLRGMPDNSVDACVTDPPYGLSDNKPADVVACLTAWLAWHEYRPNKRGFMGRTWDSWVPGPEVWREVFRVLKPGGHVVAFAGSRTHDLMSMALRLAGFENRDTVMWVYGSGFPKSMDVSKAIDKAADYKLQSAYRRAYVEAVQEAGLALPGNSRHDWTVGEHAPGDKWWAEFERWLPDLSDAERERIDRIVVGKGFKPRPTLHTGSIGSVAEANQYDITAPATDAARQWQGWGTALKPAFEPALLFRKPLSEGTVAANVLAWGTGALNIDGCRVEHVTVGDGNLALNPHLRTHINGGNGGNIIAHETERRVVTPNQSGRWPANLCHDGSDEVVALFPDSAGSGGSVPNVRVTGYGDGIGTGKSEYLGGERTKHDAGSGSAARFFYCAKASKRDRDEGLEGFEAKAATMNPYKTAQCNVCGSKTKTAGQNEHGPACGHNDWSWVRQEGGAATRNPHPTVKPTDLMRYLCRLVTPPGGLVLDPFMGSGSTGKAAMREGFRFIGCELSDEYADIAEARISHAWRQANPEPVDVDPVAAPEQRDLF